MNPPSPLTILIVDDQPNNVRLIVETLAGFGFELLTVLNGESALIAAREAAPKLILLDILMPGMDGFETCERLKQEPLTAAIPVIFLSALGEVEHKLRGFELGGVDYITKPIDPREVLARVTVHLDRESLRDRFRQRLTDRHETPASGDPSADQYARGIARVVDYLCGHLDSEPSLDELAKIAGSNRLTLSRHFKRLYGMTVFEWLREQRLSHAAKLLGESNRPISEIATTVGYSSLQGLANAFKQRFELSPSSYRNATRANNRRQ